MSPQYKIVCYLPLYKHYYWIVLSSFVCLLSHQPSLQIPFYQLDHWVSFSHNGSLFQTSTEHFQRFFKCSFEGHHQPPPPTIPYRQLETLLPVFKTYNKGSLFQIYNFKAAGYWINTFFKTFSVGLYSRYKFTKHMYKNHTYKYEMLKSIFKKESFSDNPQLPF